MLKSHFSLCNNSRSIIAQCHPVSRGQVGTRVRTAQLSSGSAGPNARLIQKLTKALCQQEAESELQHERDGAYKARAIRRAIGAMNLHPDTITSGQDAIKIIGIGGGIARRIDQFLQESNFETSDLLPSADEQASHQLSERDRALSTLKRVPGIGSVKALKLYEAGCRTLEDMRKPEHFSTLSAPIKVALDYVDHLHRRIAREQIELTLGRIRAITDSGLQYHIVGSYRRGSITSASIELIVFHPSCVYVPRPDEKPSGDLRSSATSSRKGRGRPTKLVTTSRMRQDSLLREFMLGPLERNHVAAATLSECARRWQGVARLPGESPTYRRISVTLFPQLSEGAALLEATGDNDFNAYLRRRASSQGLFLNEFGLWRWVPNNGNDASPTSKRNQDDGRWELVASKTEQEILEELGLEYVEPDRRNFEYVISKGKEESLLKQPRPWLGLTRTY